MMEALSTSEMSVNLYKTTLRIFPENNCLHTRRRENLISHTEKLHNRGRAKRNSDRGECTLEELQINI
jgi:hypothetical protein